MKSKGSMSLIVLVICVLVIGVTVYVLWDQHVAMQTKNAEAQTFAMGTTTDSGASRILSASSTSPYAAFDLYSLSTDSRTPTVTGTCGNVEGGLVLAIIDGSITPESDVLPGSPVYEARSDHGGDLDESCGVKKGDFSTRESAISLDPGEYTAALYSFVNDRGSAAQIRLLTSQSFPVEATSTDASDFRLLKSGSAVRAADGVSGYVRDDAGVYTLSADGKGAAIKGADAATFSVSTHLPILARDAHNAYIDGIVVPDADPTLVQPLDAPGWAGPGGIVVGTKRYKDGFYIEAGDSIYSFYSTCSLDAAGHSQQCDPVISRVARVGDRPPGL